jgi:hypothetical protein
MIRRVLTGVALVLTSCVAISISLDSVSAPAGSSPPAAVQQCTDGGWRTLTDASGQAFKNQGLHRIFDPPSRRPYRPGRFVLRHNLLHVWDRWL